MTKHRNRRRMKLRTLRRKNKRRVKKPGGGYHDLNTSRAIQAGRLGMYLGYQHLLFQGLQQAILALMWNEEDEKPVSVNKKVDYLNGAIDGIMRGMGILGGVLSVVKNIGLEIYRGDTYRSQRTILDVSPAAKSKYFPPSLSYSQEPSPFEKDIGYLLYVSIRFSIMCTSN